MSVMVSVSGKVHEVDDLKYVPSGTAVLSWRFSKNAGTRDKPEWQPFKAVLFGKQAESLAGKIVKDTRFSITGRQKVQQYPKKDGTTGFSIEVVVVDFEFNSDAPTQSEQKSEEEPAF